MADRIAVDYRHTTVYFETALNAVGATTSTTLRTGLAVPGANDAYVKKNGTVYPITDIVAGSAITVPRSDGGGVNQWQWDFYGWDGVSPFWVIMGTLRDANGVSAFIDANALAAPAQMILIRLSVLAGTTAALVDGDTLDLWTDVDPAGLAVRVPGENLAFGAVPIQLGLSSSGSTYYTTNDITSNALANTTMIYGGYRHTPVLGSAKYPYINLIAAIIAIGAGAGTIIEIMDSETYDIDGVIAIVGGDIYQAALGQTPTITSGVGARHSNTPTAEYNNATAIYVNPSGNNADPGTWQLPRRTLPNALLAAVAAGSSLVVGGLGAGTDPLFTLGITINNPLIIETDHGIIAHVQVAATAVIFNAAATVRNFSGVSSGSAGVGVFDGFSVGLNCENCTASGSAFAFRNFAGTGIIDRCLVENGWTGIRISGTTANMTITNCNIISVTNNGIETVVALGAATDISHNVIANCFRGIWLGADIAAANGISHNTIYNATLYGLYLDVLAFYTVVPFATIITDCAVGVYANVALTTITINYCSIDNNTTRIDGPGAAGVTETNIRVGDPLLIDPANGFFGIEPMSPCYHQNGAGDDCGPLRNILAATGANATADGFIFDGQSAIFHAIYQNVTRNGWTVTWCSFEDFVGIAVDIYGSAATDASLLNLLLEDCGVGIALPDTGNTIAETLIFGARSIGIWFDNLGNTVDHLSIHGGRYGLYLTANAGVLLGNSIFSFQSVLAIFAASNFIVTYCCIDGGVSATVDISAASNILSQPFFVSTIDGSEDYHLWSIEGGFEINSPCIDAASDGFDMGAYLLDRGVTDETWDTYVMPIVTTGVDEGIVGKNEKGFEVATGSHSLAAKTHKRRLSLRWPTDTATANEQFRHIIELLNTFVEDDHQGWTPEQIIIRVHLKPISLILGVFTGTVDVDDLTIYDATATWDRNAFRGYDATIRWYHSQVGVLNDAAKTLVVAAAAWVVDEWAGYWFRQEILDSCNLVVGHRWFRILSNTVNTITYSDPFDLSVSVVANFEFWIISPHKIASNDGQYLCLEGEDSDLLRDGDFEVYVEMLRTRLQRSGVTVRGALDYSSDQERERMPDRLRLEEI